MFELRPFGGCRLDLVPRPQRKLLFRPARRATEYFSYCEEFGCGWEAQLNALPGRFDTAAILTLPPELRPAGCTGCAAGVELPSDAEIVAPAGFRWLKLETGWMLFFTKACIPEEAGSVFAAVFRARSEYRPERDGLHAADDTAPEFNFGAAGGVSSFMQFLRI